MESQCRYEAWAKCFSQTVRWGCRPLPNRSAWAVAMRFRSRRSTARQGSSCASDIASEIAQSARRRRTDHSPCRSRVYYRALVGPFASAEEAARVVQRTKSYRPRLHRSEKLTLRARRGRRDIGSSRLSQRKSLFVIRQSVISSPLLHRHAPHGRVAWQSTLIWCYRAIPRFRRPKS